MADQVTVIPDGAGYQMVGETISGRYKVEALLGAGGMGSVYLVQHTGMRKRYALKVLNSKTAQVPEMVARFEREAMAAAHVEHPNIAVAIDFGKTDDGSFFLVLEYLEGQRLRDALAEGPIAIPRAMHIAHQIASALERSHGLGIIHRDLKPENIMLVSRQGDRDFVKVLDFGLAKVSSVEPGSDAPAQALTKAGTIFGTPKYMAPEQCVTGPIDGRADLYALGLILYEMLTGVHPFAAKDMLRIIRHQLTTPTPPMKTLAPAVSIPASLEAVVMRLTEKQADNRYENATALLAALAEVAEREGIPSPEHASGPVTALPSAAKANSNASKEPQTVASVDIVSVVAAQPAAPTEKEAAKPPILPSTPTPAIAPSVPVPSSAPRKESALQPILDKLPPPLRKLPPAVLLGGPVVLLGLLLFLILRSGAPTEAPKVADKTPIQKPTASTAAPQAQLDQATAAGTSALLQLARQFPKDAKVSHELARAYLAQKNGLEALRFLAKAVAIDPGTASENEIKQATALAMSSTESAEAMITALEGELGAFGVDVLYALATRPGVNKSKARFTASLAKAEVRAHASPAALIALELRAADKCEGKRALLNRAAQDGDQRTLEQLKLLTVTRNCGGMGLLDCWPCLRKDTALQGAISSIEARVGASN